MAPKKRSRKLPVVFRITKARGGYRVTVSHGPTTNFQSRPAYRRIDAAYRAIENHVAGLTAGGYRILEV